MGNRLEDRVAIVTGSGRGIGRGVALQLAEEGASVVVNDLGVSVDGADPSGGPAAEVVEEIRAAGGEAVPAYDSVAEYDSAAKIVQTAIDNYGKVDILVHLAGILRDRMIFNMTEDEWDAVLQVHLYGAFNMVRNVVPHMIEQRYGRIVIFSSGSGLGAAGQSNYAAAKEGQVGFARALARELAPHGITVNAVYPGGNTRMADAIPEASKERYRQMAKAEAESKGLPYVELPESAGDPGNNAPKAAYLCTEAAGNITGQVIGVSGWPMQLYSARHVVASINKDGPWTLDELDRDMLMTIGKDLANTAPYEPPRE